MIDFENQTDLNVEIVGLEDIANSITKREIELIIVDNPTIKEINFEYKRFLASFKAPDENYVDQVITLTIDCCGVDFSKFHCVKSAQRIDLYHFLKIKEQNIIDIIKNKAYD